MTEFLSIIPLIKDPTSITFWVALVLIGIGVWMKYKKISLEEYASKGNRLDAEFERLTEALNLMSERLVEANAEADTLRKRVSDMHTQILEMKEEISVLRQYKEKFLAIQSQDLTKNSE